MMYDSESSRSHNQGQRPNKPSWVGDTTAISYVPRTFLGKVRALMKRAIVIAGERGWFGLRKLEVHVVICGFPRSGSTLLQLMATTCIKDLKKFRDERAGLISAQYAVRNHRFMLTKSPNDIFMIDEIRDYYSSRECKAIFIITIRDPRDILTSRHAGRPDKYYVSTQRWENIYAHYLYVRKFPDICEVKYEELIEIPEEIEKQLREFIGWKQIGSFQDFINQDLKKFNTVALGGVRPIESSRISRWKESVHRDRLKAILTNIPDLPKHLIELGYESDEFWIKDYQID